MPFACQHAAVSGLKEFRRDRHRLPMLCTDQEYLRAFASICCRNLTHLASAALLWFESRAREDQVKLLLDFEAAGSTRDKRRARNVSVIAWIGRRFRAWNFRQFTQGHVVGAAVSGFCALDLQDRRAWLAEAMNEPVGNVEAASPPLNQKVSV